MNCEKLNICTDYIAVFAGVNNQEGKDKLFHQVQKCIKCDRLDNCIQYFMTKFKITNMSLLRSGFVMKFRNCAEKKEQKTSLDLPEHIKGSVGSKFGGIVPPKTDK